uniref:Dynein heavy chain linker domain-containing protein n=1 Tax=Electrophorus electricus TaxID=8005 RepID=A0A4W4EIL8_ELEEL
MPTSADAVKPTSGSGRSKHVVLPPIPDAAGQAGSVASSTEPRTAVRSKLLRHSRGKQQQKRQVITSGFLFGAYTVPVLSFLLRALVPPLCFCSHHPLQMNYTFLKQCVERSPIMPIQQQWLDATLSRVPSPLRHGPGRQELLEELCREVSEEFLHVMVKHTVNSFLIKPQIKGTDPAVKSPPLAKTLDFSRPWHSSFVKSRKKIEENLHILHPVMKIILDICHVTFSQLLLVDLSGCRYLSMGPVDCENLKNKVAVECERSEKKLMNTWFLNVIHLITSKDTVQGIRAGKLEAFNTCASTLLSNQLKALLERNVQAFVSLFEPLDTHKLPLFRMHLTFDDEKMDFYPSVQEIEDVVLQILSLITNTMQKVQTVRSWQAEANKSLVDAKLAEHILTWARNTLTNSVRKNLEAPRRHFQYYFDNYDWLVNGTAQARVKKFLEEEHSFDQYAGQVEEFRAVSREISSLPSLIHFDMIYLDCEELKQGLAKKAKTFAQDLLQRLISTHREHCLQICKQFETIQDKAIKIPETTEDMVEMISYINHAKNKGLEELSSEISEMHNRLNYLLDVHLFDAEDLELNSRVLLCPQNITPIFDLNDEVTLTGQCCDKREQELQVRREKLMLELEKLSRRVEEFAECSELEMMQQYVTEIRTVQKRLQEAEESVVFINKEEALYKWDQTAYPEVEVLRENTEPYQKLFGLVLKWQRTERRWMDGSFLDLNGESMEVEVDEFYREIYKMLKLFQQKEKKMDQEKTAAVKRRSGEGSEDKQESPTALICSSIMEQIKDFKVQQIIIHFASFLFCTPCACQLLLSAVMYYFVLIYELLCVLNVLPAYG